MRIDVYHHVDVASDEVVSKLNAILTKLESIERKVDHMAGELDVLESKVGAIKDVVDSAVTLLDGLKLKLDEAIAALPDPAKLNALSDALGEKTQSLADAIVRDTPAA